MTTARLLKYDAARTALAEAHRVDEAKDIRDKALALAAYARQAQDRDMIAWATEIKLRAERRTGELLRETSETDRRQGKGRPEKTSSNGDIFTPKRLRDLGITRDQSSDWQKLAAIPEPEFERRIQAAAGEPATMTTAKILKPPGVTKPVPWEDEARVWSGVSGWLMRAQELPALNALKSVRPKGGLRTALRERLTVADAYMATLKKLHREDWL